ncbi:TonB-system energizer ExbB [Campylobacter geochelonis]|uniref:TonB-system energizer ExbB n=1 Tax=Campylobacter geochelonis TaxID=1780362 RepID=A0A128ECK8_9BACT|nr:TonB-system energizer ExbB [Campylobacter geochelonis]QKF70528.1 TonB system transport protein ExbB [Campylobacter geochelonis]CZE46102.1 TonB-system energizer ExbB [Campylobacter geochelonis]CZE46532.1 TonB-system energizer ExbB [Campylobacter geochelonis]CZE50430.1 TonB-system energizer ExbB [Campylobacter geochelonis]
MDFLRDNVESLIIIILGFMSFIVVVYTIERLYFYAKIKIENYQSEEELEVLLTKNLTTLYIIYSNAPYIGLLGTVAGIMITFYDMGMAGGGVDAKSIMIGMSLALKATAAGLLVAIPTLMIYNAFSRKVEVILAKFRIEHEKKLKA